MMRYCLAVAALCLVCAAPQRSVADDLTPPEKLGDHEVNHRHFDDPERLASPHFTKRCSLLWDYVEFFRREFHSARTYEERNEHSDKANYKLDVLKRDVLLTKLRPLNAGLTHNIKLARHLPIYAILRTPAGGSPPAGGTPISAGGVGPSIGGTTRIIEALQIDGKYQFRHSNGTSDTAEIPISLLQGLSKALKPNLDAATLPALGLTNQRDLALSLAAVEKLMVSPQAQQQNLASNIKKSDREALLQVAKLTAASGLSGVSDVQVTDAVINDTRGRWANLPSLSSEQILNKWKGSELKLEQQALLPYVLNSHNSTLYDIRLPNGALHSSTFSGFDQESGLLSFTMPGSPGAPLMLSPQGIDTISASQITGR